MAVAFPTGHEPDPTIRQSRAAGRGGSPSLQCCRAALRQRTDHTHHDRACGASRPRAWLLGRMFPELGRDRDSHRAVGRIACAEDRACRGPPRRRRHEQGHEDGRGAGSGFHRAARCQRGRCGAEGDRPAPAGVGSALRRSCRRGRGRPRSHLWRRTSVQPRVDRRQRGSGGRVATIHRHAWGNRLGAGLGRGSTGGARSCRGGSLLGGRRWELFWPCAPVWC